MTFFAKAQYGLINRAIQVATMAHEDQFDKQGMPYILHPIEVMKTVKSKDPMVLQVAVMHDVLEDSDITEVDLRKKFHSNVVDALVCLTHLPDEDYDDYIKRISTNRMAMLVKLADLRHNLCVTRLPDLSDKTHARISKYHRSYKFLKECLKDLD